MDEFLNRLKGWKLVTASGFALVAFGAAVIMYLSQFALASDLKDHVQVSTERYERLERDVGDLRTRAAVIEALQRNVEADLHWQREQAAETARRVGARVVPSPHHE